MEKYQLESPNNARVFIDYRKENKVKFEYVAKDSIFRISFGAWYRLWFLRLGYLPVMLIFIGLGFITYDSTFYGFHLLFFIFLTSAGLQIYGVPLIMAYLTTKSKKLTLLLPKLNAIGQSRFYEVEFNPEDIKESKLEIPLFRNVLLIYKATDEMSDYLERVEITEHPFNYYIKHKKKPNQYLWKAIFYFSNIPKSGTLKVRFH